MATDIERAALKVVSAARKQERSGRVNFKSVAFHDAFNDLAAAIDDADAKLAQRGVSNAET